MKRSMASSAGRSSGRARRRPMMCSISRRRPCVANHLMRFRSSTTRATSRSKSRSGARLTGAGVAMRGPARLGVGSGCIATPDFRRCHDRNLMGRGARQHGPIWASLVFTGLACGLNLRLRLAYPLRLGRAYGPRIRSVRRMTWATLTRRGRIIRISLP